MLTMTANDSSTIIGFRATKAWGQVRRRSFIARVLHTVSMTLMGLLALAGVVVMTFFAGLVALLGVFAVSMMGFVALLTRKPVRVSVRTKPSANGVFEARKNGSSWEVY